MNIKYKDLREWVTQMEKNGQLKVVKGANIEEDAGMLAEMLSHSDEGPAVLMDSITGYPDGFRILINANGAKPRIEHTFGFEPTSDNMSLVEAFRDKFEKVKPIPPVVVNDGAVMENKMTGGDVDLFKFPVPKWHLEDGGPYIGTGDCVITREPEEDWINLGTYRAMLQSKNQIGFYISNGKHGWQHREKYFKEGKPCPVAVVIGGDPLLTVASTLEIPYGVSEYEWAGGIRGEPYSVIIDNVTGLPIPAEAEIVLVGYSYPDQKAPEGPFGEWTGYYASGTREEPYIKVEAVYYRNNPIILGIPPNKPPYEAHKYRQYIRSGMLLNSLKKIGVAGVKAAWCHGVGGCRLLNAVAIEQRFAGHATQVGTLLSQLPEAAYINRITIVTDDDIDVSDLEDLMWAVSTRYDPATDSNIINKAWSGNLDPMVSPEAMKKGELYNSRIVIDATKPWHWRNEFPKPIGPDLDYRQKTREKWGHLL